MDDEMFESKMGKAWKEMEEYLSTNKTSLQTECQDQPT